MGSKKRGNGQGSVYRLSNGKWRAEWTVGYDVDGKRKSKRKGGFTTKKEALAYIEAAKKEIVYERMTIEQIYAMVLPEIEKLSKSKRTAYSIAYRRILPLKFRIISEVRLPELQKLVDGVPGPFYPKRDVRSLLNKIFEYAVINDWCEKNYAQYIKLPACPEPE